MKESYLEDLISYAGLGYEITLINLYGKEGIRMVKKHSYIAEGPICCEQIIDWERLHIKERRNHIFDFMYKDIQDQENKNKYYKPLSDEN